MRVIGVGLAAAFFGLVLGFLAFLYQVHASARFPKRPADAIVVFSGDPLRIIAATDLLKKGYGRRLFIVGQDNGNEIKAMRAKNSTLFECCVEIERKSQNTAEDATVARNLIINNRSQSILLVTSSFHVPRAKKELTRLMPGIVVTTFGVADDFFKIEDILRNPNVGPAFLSQYLKYLAVSLPSTREMIGEQNGRKIFQFTSSLNNLVLLIITLGALLVAAVAFLKHRARHYAPPKRDIKN